MGGGAIRVVASVAALVLLAGCADVGSSGAPSTSTSTSASSTSSVTASSVPSPVLSDVPPVPAGPASALVDRLVVAEPFSPSDYRRKAFGGDWDYDSTTGCNTRELVLAEESGPGLVVDDRCKPLDGTWTSVYDGLVTSDPADLEIDHLVPLAEAWRTGAASWSDELRERFANDRDDPGTLVAVSSSSNRSKQDSTPAQWLPETAEGRCVFVENWVRVKFRWGLTVAPDEKVAITQVLAGC